MSSGTAFVHAGPFRPCPFRFHQHAAEASTTRITAQLVIKETTVRAFMCMLELKIFVFWRLHFDIPFIMATRNLTPEFNKYRQASGRKRPLNQSSSTTSSLIGGEM